MLNELLGGIFLLVTWVGPYDDIYNNSYVDMHLYTDHGSDFAEDYCNISGKNMIEKGAISNYICENYTVNDLLFPQRVAEVQGHMLHLESLCDADDNQTFCSRKEIKRHNKFCK